MDAQLTQLEATRDMLTEDLDMLKKAIDADQACGLVLNYVKETTEMFGHESNTYSSKPSKGGCCVIL